jgi:signal transduction histidine kinase
MNQFLTAIMAHFQLIPLHVKNEPEISAYCADGMEAVERILELRSDVISFAKGESAFRKADVNRILEEAALMLKADLRMEQLVHMYCEIPLTECSPFALRLAFLNILRNAAQAIEPENGKITISTRLLEGHIEVKISDDGKGMDESQLKNIFSGVSTKESGHGIGACFMKYVVEKHGGSVSYESAPGAGTTVTVLLPVYSH